MLKPQTLEADEAPQLQVDGAVEDGAKGGRLGGVEALDGFGEGFALLLCISDSGNRHGFNGVEINNCNRI